MNQHKWMYPEQRDGRDLRLDFMRGLIMIYVIVVHMEFGSLFSLLAWERLGLVSSAEGFVFLSGLIVGLVYKKKLIKEGIKHAASKLWRRAFQLYRVNIVIILSIALLGLLPFINVYDLTHWVMPGNSSEAYLLYPEVSTPWWQVLIKALLLQIGPHQFQVIGLYVILLAFAPIALFAMHKNKTLFMLGISGLLYGLNHYFHLRLTGARFEYGFPLLTWQLIFFSGMAVGYHRERILGFITARANRGWIYLALTLCLMFLFIAANQSRPLFWPWGTLSFISPETYAAMYGLWFQKTTLGLGRLLNNLVLYMVLYYLLHHYWRLFEKALGWLLIPLGQASFYVFILHIYFILLISNTPFPEMDSFVVNTLLHLFVVLTIWLMVKRKFLFQIIPR